jgi:hypothetical protein
LEAHSRQQVVELNDRILQEGQQFAAGTHKSRTNKKLSLPRQIRHHFNVHGDNITLSSNCFSKYFLIFIFFDENTKFLKGELFISFSVYTKP